jgi:TetR/AcrR family transcriptional regulator, transcriptional repressor for nem operon
MTTAADHPTRIRLLDAGVQLGAQQGLSSVSVNNVVTEAHVAKGTFYVHFKDRTDYLVSLHRRFHDRLFIGVVEAIAGLPPGFDRLERSIFTYLNGCLQEKLTRAILFDAHFEMAIRIEIAERNEAAAKSICIDLEAMSIGTPRETARLVIAMTVDVAIAEQNAHGPLPPLRSAMFNLFKRDSPTSPEEV